MPDDNIEYRVSGHGEADEDPGFPVSCLDSFILQQTDRQIADVVKLRVSEESGPDLDDGGSGSTSIQPSRESAKALIRDTGYYDTGAVGVSELYK
ncbi:MAG: hypothetical protein KJ882_07795, partial [Proteobacteria bacterium]|nr:hypothetical protein [Pseudomonadota bacterium]